MESVFNIEPEDIIIRDKPQQDKQYNFLDGVNIPNKEIYYKIVSTIIDYKLKNLYMFIYLRLYKINKEYSNINVIENIKYNISSHEFNEILKSFVDSKDLNAIIIMNAIQIYFT